MRWSLSLQEFELDIKHIKGKDTKASLFYTAIVFVWPLNFVVTLSL